MAAYDRENWLKAALALQYTKEGLEQFVVTEIQTMHQQMLDDLYKGGVAPGTVCSSCTTQNIIRCSSKGTCGKRCRIHDTSDPSKAYRPCPNHVCDTLMNSITLYHRFGPTWANTDARLWCTDAWEMAKCYLPHGCGKSKSAQDVDMTGLLNVIINNSRFQLKLSEDMKNDKNLFCEARDIRNTLLHSGSFKLPAADLTKYFTVLEDILGDPRYLIVHLPAIEAVVKITKMKTNPLTVGREEAAQMREDAKLQYEEDKRRFQHYLANRYLEQNIKIPLSFPVNLEADVEDVYVSPALRQVPLSHETGHEGRQQQLPAVESYHEIFHRHSQRCRNIYIKGDAGTGKTSLCQRVVFSWCKYVKQEELKDDETFIKNFSFLFYIPLRNVVALTDMDEMIFVQLLNQHADNKELVRRILDEDSEKCLLMLDGLDEYTCKESTASMDISKGLPHRDVARRCTIVTTTRSWKLEAIRMKPSEMDQLVELRGLDDQSSKKYIDSLVNCLNQKFGRTLSGKDFEKDLSRMKLDKLRTLPVLLRHMVCLWHDGKSLGNSLCEIYSGILDMLLDMSRMKTAGCDESQKLDKQILPCDKSLPRCFSGRQNCQEFGSLLMALSRLAFNTLFDENRESCLVFDKSTAELHGMTPEEIQACLQVGLLSKDIVLEQCSVQQRSLSFLHKSMQECLAALYVCLCPEEESDIYITICHCCTSVERVLEMSGVIVFMSGMAPTMVSKLSTYIGGVISEDKRVQAYRVDVSVVGTAFIQTKRLVGSIQDMMTDCMKESSCNGHPAISVYIEDILCYDRDKKEEDDNDDDDDDDIDYSGVDASVDVDGGGDADRDVTLGIDADGGDQGGCSSGSGGGDIDYKGGVASVDVGSGGGGRDVTLGIDCINKYVELLLESNNGHIKSIHIRQYSPVLQKVTQTGVLQRLSWRVHGTSHLSTLSGIIDRSRDSLKRLDLYDCDLSAASISDMFQDLSQLQAINLNFVQFRHEQIQWLMTYLSSGTELRHIHLYVCECTYCNQSNLGRLDLSQHTQLTTLVLGRLCIDQIRINPSCLQECTLVLVRPGVVTSVMRSLRASACLQRLEVYYCPDKDQDTLINTIPTLHHIKEIILTGVHLHERVLTMSPLMTQLEWVVLMNCKMSLKSVYSFVDSLPNRQGVHVDMCWIPIIPMKDSGAVLDYIKALPNIEVIREDSTDDSINDSRMGVYFNTTGPTGPSETQSH